MKQSLSHIAVLSAASLFCATVPINFARAESAAQRIANLTFGPPVTTGQPMQSCQAAADYPADTPGHSYTAPGSAFNPNGVADAKYAGTQPQNSKNPTSVAQYDVACTNQKPK
jgi:hypothetical protein